ncbi:MAG TPA: LPS export ABC transporter permease LptF [Candidatus Manganitrophaceae bacterium]|nr:LPS export ABC transporter permease LptF [Candidatus Manganitrophaceae bacterium]
MIKGGGAPLKIIDRYILKELAAPFLLGIFILTFLILTHQLLRMMELVIDKGVGLLSVGQIFLLLLPSFFLVTIPTATLLASVMTFNRLSSDNEIIALKSAGVGFYRLMRPVFLFATAAALLTLYMAMIAQPWGGSSFKSLSMRILMKRAGVGLEEGRFNETFPNMMIYVESMPTFTELEGIFIYDLRKPENPLLIAARKGFLISDPDTKKVELRLMDGSLHRRGKEISDYQRMTFASYDLKIDFSAALSNSTLENPSYQELREKIRASGGEDTRSLRLLSEFYKNYSFPLASFLFGLIGVPLGIISGRTGRLGAFTVGIGVITLYYLLITLGDYLISRRLTPPFAAAWLPSLALIPLSVYLLKMMADESFPKFLRSMIANKRP